MAFLGLDGLGEVTRGFSGKAVRKDALSACGEGLVSFGHGSGGRLTSLMVPALPDVRAYQSAKFWHRVFALHGHGVMGFKTHYPTTHHSTMQGTFTPSFGGKAGKRVK
jgi:hypothetical protein